MLDKQGLLRLRLLQDIGRVASLAYQERLCLQGTAEEYVLLDELVDTTVYAAQHDVTHPILSRKWTAEQKQAISDFARQAGELSDRIEWRNPEVSLAEITQSEPMRLMREAATECLRCVGVSFTLEELLRD